MALSFGAGILLAFLLIGDFTAWHAVPIIAISVLAEAVGLVMGYFYKLFALILRCLKYFPLPIVVGLL